MNLKKLLDRLASSAYYCFILFFVFVIFPPIVNIFYKLDRSLSNLLYNISLFFLFLGLFFVIVVRMLERIEKRGDRSGKDKGKYRDDRGREKTS